MVRRRSGSDEKKGAPEWVVSYGDMMSLLLCFFILLFAFSSVDALKFQAVLLSLKGSFGVMEGGMTTNQGDLTGGADVMPSDSGLMELEPAPETVTAAEVESALAEAGLTGTVQLVEEQRGMVIRFVDSTLFESGKAGLTPKAMDILDKTAGIITGMDNLVRIEGHTDNRPINTAQFPSNWELSTARATTVIRHFVEVHRIAPERLAAAGYGEYYPIAPNDTAANRALNRRIDIVILRSAASEPARTPVLPAVTYRKGR